MRAAMRSQHVKDDFGCGGCCSDSVTADEKLTHLPK